MAHKKGQGSSRNGRDSNPKMLGIKLFGGQYAKPGSIICRQNGTKWQPGKNVGVGRDWTIFSLVEGTVRFDQEGGGSTSQPLAASCGGPRADRPDDSSHPGFGQARPLKRVVPDSHGDYRCSSTG